MRPTDPYDLPLRVTAIDGEVVFLGEGPVHFAMTRAAAVLTLHNLAAALAGPPEADAPPEFDARVEPARAVVLVVDDEPLVRTLAAEVLEDAGYAVIQADGPRQALLALEARGEIHLLISDVQMPGELTGVDLAVLVRARWPRVRLLLTSGYPGPSLDRLPEGGRFLAKPYVVADMVREVEDLMAA